MFSLSCRIPPNLGLPAKGWSTNNKGYVVYTSRKLDAELPRGKKCHIAVMEKLVGKQLRLFANEQNIHHQDFNKENNCPYNLILLPACMNPSTSTRDPYTGEFLSKQEYERRYKPKKPRSITNEDI